MNYQTVVCRCLRSCLDRSRHVLVFGHPGCPCCSCALYSGSRPAHSDPQRDLRSDSARGLCDMMALRGSLGPVARVSGLLARAPVFVTPGLQLARQMAQRAEPTPPKKPLSAYFLWLGENRARIAGSLGEDGKKVTLVSKAAGAEWKTLSDKVKKPFADTAAELKADFLAKKEAFERQGGVIPARKSKKAAKAAKAKKTKDPSLPKRPKNAYMLWLDDHRKEISDALGPGHLVKEVAVEAGKRWRTCSDAEKSPYVAKASELKQAYNKQKQ